MLAADTGRWLTEDPVGFAAGDTNLYRYVGNSPTNVSDPTGLFVVGPVATAPTIDIGKSSEGVDAGVLRWPIITPEPPKDLSIYTEVDMKWTINKTEAKAEKPREGSYRFWLEGLRAPPELLFNLSPYHGSHASLNRKGYKEWPQFKNDEELTAYLKRSYDLRGTTGTLTVRLEFRGYTKKGGDKFNPELKPEQGGPFEMPGETVDLRKPSERVLRAPNRVRSPFRPLGPWSSAMPKIWAAAPEWKHTLVFKVNWDWSSDKFAALYRVEYPNYTEAGHVPVSEQ